MSDLGTSDPIIQDFRRPMVYNDRDTKWYSVNTVFLVGISSRYYVLGFDEKIPARRAWEETVEHLKPMMLHEKEVDRMLRKNKGHRVGGKLFMKLLNESGDQTV